MAEYNIGESPSKNKEQLNPSIRFTATIKDERLLKSNLDLLDRNFKNPLQDCNLQFSLYFRDTNQAIKITTIEAPSYT